MTVVPTTPAPAPTVEELSSSLCWQLLREAVVGRLAVVVDGAPDLFPVNHIVDHGTLVFRTGDGTKLAASLGHRVAYEVDGLTTNGVAWSVVAHGTVHEVVRLHDLVDALGLPLQPWQAGAKPHYLRIEVTQVSGRRFTAVAR